MAATLIGVIYDVATIELRQIIVPDDDSELDTSHPPADGQALITLPRSRFPSLITQAELPAIAKAATDQILGK